jgi:hypothetical protein
MFSKVLEKLASWFVIAIPADTEDSEEAFYYYCTTFHVGYLG